jgi:hypothetical protein
MDRDGNSNVQEFEPREFLFLVMLSAVAEANELRLPRNKTATLTRSDHVDGSGAYPFADQRVARTLHAVSQHCAGDHRKYVAACTRLFALNKMLKHPKAKDFTNHTRQRPIVMDPVLLAAARCPVRQFGEFSTRQFFAIVKEEVKKLKSETRSPIAERKG